MNGINSCYRFEKYKCIVEGELIEAITGDEEETIVLIRKNSEETMALILTAAAVRRDLMSMRENIICLKKNCLTEKLRDLMPQ